MAKAKYSHEKLKSIALNDTATKNAYDELEEEFTLLNARLQARKPQEEAAELMRTPVAPVLIL